MPKIINFHDIHNAQWFEDTLDVIQELYEIVPFAAIQDFYDGKKCARNIAHLTVDDGHTSTYHIIYPILKKRGLTASIFVSPKITLVGGNFWYHECGDYEQQQLLSCLAEVHQIPEDELKGFYPVSVMKTRTLASNWEVIRLYQQRYHIQPKPSAYMDAEQLLELERSGIFHIGAHTMNHPILANENDATASYEIKESIRQLSEILQRKVTTFAYPNGSPGLDFGTREMRLLQESGIQHAFSFEFKDLSKNDSVLSIPRYGLYRGSKDFVRKKLKYGKYWESLNKRIFNNEDKHRKLILKTFNSQHVQS